MNLTAIKKQNTDVNSIMTIKKDSYQRGIAYVTNAHINHETLIKSFNKKCKIKSH